MSERAGAEGRSNLLIQALHRRRRAFWYIGVLSVFANLLALVGSAYMLLIYDKVLSSASRETLIAVSVIVIVLLLMLGLFEHVRGRIVSRIGAAMQSELDAEVFRLTLDRKPHPDAGHALADLETIQKFFSSPVVYSVFDAVLAPMFLVILFMVHAWLGWFAVVAGGLLLTIAVLNQRITRRSLEQAAQKSRQGARVADELARERELILAMGMQSAARARWEKHRLSALTNQIASSDAGGVFSSLSKTIRSVSQSAILGLGAWLVLLHELEAGFMIAASILMGRALAPIEQTIGHWGLIAKFRTAWTRLSGVLASAETAPKPTELPHPKGEIVVDQLTVVPPGRAAPSVKLLSFNIEPGEAVGIIGSSGSGKSSLAKAIAGIWPVQAGTIRLGKATIDQYDPEQLGRYIGYLPQEVVLFTGTVAENIARLDGSPAATAKVIEAARRAGAHEMILGLPKGYDTPVAGVSGGQRQRIGLARALFGDPVLLILDEPNSSLDQTGSKALNDAVRHVKSQGGSILVIAHRPSALVECDKILIIENGVKRDFGPTTEIMRGQLSRFNAAVPPQVAIR